MKNINAKLQKDLKNLDLDLKKLTLKKNLYKDVKYLKKLAQDIKNLNNDLSIIKQNKKTAIIYYLLSTPFGAPFVSDKTLVEAALSFECQKPLTSDLSYLILKLSKYDEYFNHEIYQIFDSFLKN